MSDEETKIEVVEVQEIVPADTNAELSRIIDEKITEIVVTSLNEIAEDRTAAKDLRDELRELFLNGETHPDFIRELNNAQDNTQKSTENLIKVLDKLAKVKVGADKVQIAQITQTNSNDDNAEFNKATLIEMLEEQFPPKK